MPLKRIEVKIRLLEKIAKAIREVKEAGVTDPETLIKKILHSKLKYKEWKDRKTK